MQQELSAVAEPKPTIVDALNEDANPRPYPDGAPTLWPYLKLPFKERARFFSIYRTLQARQADLSSMEKKHKRGKLTDQQMLASAEGLYELYGMMDDLMRVAAVDKDAYDEWVSNADDEQFATLFQIYLEHSQPGGSVKLGELIDKYGQELLADFADRDIDLRDLWREGSTLTPRYCLILAGQLGEDSAFAAAHRGGPHFRPWTTPAHLMAVLVNLTHAANRQRGGKQTRKPLVTPPTKEKPRKITVAELLSGHVKAP